MCVLTNRNGFELIWIWV